MVTPPPLWGGTVEKINIDLATQAVSISVRVNDSRQSPPITDHTLQFSGVSELRWFNSIPGPWDYAELTEIHVSESDDGKRHANIVLWSEDAGLSIIAESVLLDGKDLQV